MGRRVYYMNPKKQRLKQEMILSYREALKSIDPALLESARLAIAKAVLSAREQQEQKAEPQSVPIDRKKNIETIIRFLEIKAQASPQNSEIRALLTELMH